MFCKLSAGNQLTNTNIKDGFKTITPVRDVITFWLRLIERHTTELI